MKLWSLMLVVSMLVASPALAQDVNRIDIKQLTKLEPASAKLPNSAARPSYLLPPQGQPADNTAKQSSETSHKKRNIIIAVVVAAAVGGVIVAAHNGAYGGGSSSSGY